MSLIQMLLMKQINISIDDQLIDSKLMEGKIN